MAANDTNTVIYLKSSIAPALNQRDERGETVLVPPFLKLLYGGEGLNPIIGTYENDVRGYITPTRDHKLDFFTLYDS